MSVPVRNRLRPAPGRLAAIRRLPPVALLYPDVCPVCREEPPLDRGEPCRTCSRALPYVTPPVCGRCGSTLDTEYAECRECRDHPRQWHGAATAFAFDGLARECVHRFKYHGDTALTPLLARAAFNAWQDHGPTSDIDMLVPVPLHWLRRLRRGYNQAALLGHYLSLWLDRPLRPLLVRRRYTRPQASLSRTRRLKNLKRAFRTRRRASCDGARVLLVDDVMTTGATLEQCTRQLLDAGAAHVYVLTAARR